jgi:hypothetical protein
VPKDEKRRDETGELSWLMRPFVKNIISAEATDGEGRRISLFVKMDSIPVLCNFPNREIHDLQESFREVLSSSLPFDKWEAVCRRKWNYG